MPKTSGKPKSEYAIQTVANALRVLEVFHTQPEIGVSELARRLDLHKNNAFRLLATLELSGYVQQSSGTDSYRLAPRCLELGHAFSRHHSLMREARPILEELSAKVGETAHLGQLNGSDVVHLDGVVADQPVLTGLRVGERVPAHCTALGKSLLSGRLVREQRRPLSRAADRSAEGDGHGECDGAESILDESSSFITSLMGRSFESRTPSTIVEPGRLVDELRTVHRRGYAVDLEEYAPGLRCVAAPIRDATHRVVAALTVSGPVFRLSEESLHGEVARAVVAAATQLSQQLGALF